jgi:hypothetical protein
VFNSIWLVVCKKHSGLDKPESKVTISADQLKSLCSQMYHRGVRDGHQSMSSGARGTLNDIFGGIFNDR